MSDIFFTDSSEVPVPPEEVRIRALTALARADGQRIDTAISLTPFQQKPNVELVIENAEGQELSSLSVVEAIDATMEFTMHIRGKKQSGEHILKARVFYAEIESYEKAKNEDAISGDILKEASQDVDTREISFNIE